MNSVPTFDWFRLGSSFALVVGLLLAMLWLLKRLKSMQKTQGPAKQLEIIESLSVGVRQKLALVRVGQHQVLVGITPGQFTALGQWPLDQAASPTFAQTLAPLAEPGTPHEI